MFKFFNIEATVTAQPSSAAPATATTPLYSDEQQQQQQGTGRLVNLTRQVRSLKRKVSCPDYYDPYQREQQAEDPSPVMEDQRPTKRQRGSVASTLIDGVVRRIHYGATMAMSACEYFWGDDHGDVPKGAQEKMNMRQHNVLFQQPAAWELRLQQVENFIRRLCSYKQQEEQQDPFLNLSFFPPLAMEAYRQAIEDEKNGWGIVFKEDFQVRFTQPFTPSLCTPPTKPKRTYTHRRNNALG